MALSTGARLGTYQITAPLGVGGMGEVYRATDTNLGRHVAIKVLPAAVAQDSERLARFDREARTLAALNHPNIAAIYGVEDAGGVKALVMELVEGPTLAERIAQGAIPVDEALPIAKQIAEALEAAHEQGIVHRDLKPANIKVRADGTVKVLDFGLAKAIEPGNATPPSLTQSPTITTPAMTQMGMILGTAAYMSPEQARGRRVDKRTDIWAFGCVLYEMLTGKRAFQAEDISMTLAEVMKSEPDFSALPDQTPTGVRQALRLCLQKEPRQRGGDVAAIRLALEGALETASRLDERSASARPFWRRTIPVVAGMFAGGLLVSAGWWSVRPVEEPVEVSRFEYSLPSGLLFRNTGRSVIAISPDGRHVVFNTAQGLFLRSMGELEGRLLPGTEEGLVGPFFSPDSEWVAYVTSARELKRVSLSGGQPVAVASGFSEIHGGSWATGDTILLGVTEGIARVPAAGGTPEVVIPAAEAETVYGPQLLPDGESVLFSVVKGSWNQGQNGEIVVQSLRTGMRTSVLRGGSDARYVPSGHLVYSLRDGLFAVGFDVQRLTVTGAPVSIVPRVSRSAIDVTGAANYGVSRGGTLIYLPDFGLPLRQLRWFDRSGTPQETVGSPQVGVSNIALAPDESRVLLNPVGSDQPGIWVADMRRNVTSLLALGTDGSWSPDGSLVAFSRSGRALLTIPANGGEARTFFAPTSNLQLVYVESWHPNGEHVAAHMSEGAVDTGVIISTTGDQAPIAFDQTTNSDEEHFSPDGNWIAYSANRDGRGWEVYVVPYPPTGERTQVSAGGGMQPVWRADGRELYYLTPQGTLMAVPIATEGGFSPGAPVTLFKTALTVDPNRDQYAVSRDGRRFLISVAPESNSGTAARVIIVANWFEELKRLVPVN
jgi:serine/threonine-protein kinase